MSNASDLLYAYGQAELAIEAAEEAIEQARAKKLEVFDEILKNKPLLEALQGPGVIDNKRVLTIEAVNSAVIEIKPIPVYSYELIAEDSEPF